jgi:hypothetical protein
MTPVFVTTVDLEEAELDEALDLNAAEDKIQQYACQEENDDSDEYKVVKSFLTES